MRQVVGVGILFILIAAEGCHKGYSEPHTDPIPPSPKKWVVTTIAGEGTQAFRNGQALLASFHFPEAVAAGNNGNIFITDAFNRIIRRLAADQVTTFAGNGQFGIVDGAPADARFEAPFAIVVDANGYLFTTDENDSRIRRVSPGGEVLTYAGSVTAGFADGNAFEARFMYGNYLAVDLQGNLFVSDVQNHRIRKVSTAGEVTTVAGTGVAGFSDGNAVTAQFNFPAGIAVDSAGNIYVADRGNLRIRKISTNGMVTTLAGSGQQGYQDGNSTEARFQLDMRSLIVDRAGNLILSESDYIRMITPQGVVSTIAGGLTGFRDGEGSQAQFNYPNGLAGDDQGNIYVADLNNSRIRRISFQ